MAGVGFELKRIFKDNSGVLSSIKGYSITAVVTEGPMVLTMVMLFALQGMIQYFHGSFRDREVFLFLIAYVMIFSILLSNTLLMFFNRYIADCIYQNRLHRVLPAFYAIITALLAVGGTLAFLYLASLSLAWNVRLAAQIQFCTMLVLWVQIVLLSAIRQYTYVLWGFVGGALVSLGLAGGMMALHVQPLSAAMWGAASGFVLMMFLFMKQILEFYPAGRLRLHPVLAALERYRILVPVGACMGLGLYAHNFVHWCSGFQNRVFSNGVYCTRYDIPSFFAVLTILPMTVQFVVSLETAFAKKNRAYFDAILGGGRLQDMKAAQKEMQQVLYRELAYMMEIQLVFTLFAVVFGGNFLQGFGLDVEMAGIYRVLCFGYLVYGFVKSMIIILLYFDDRIGALRASAMFAALSAVLSAAAMLISRDLWGFGFLLAGLCTAVYLLRRLRLYLDELEYHVFCEQPLFVVDTEGRLGQEARKADKAEEEYRRRSEKRVENGQ